MTRDAQPIVFRVGGDVPPTPTFSDTGATVCLLTRTRALEGMQKEALVQQGPSGSAWRLLCDEGPWLNGTDLAPFPLGYFAAGLVSCLLSDIRSQAQAREFDAGGLSARLEIRFTMEGSILRGTMAAGVESMTLAVAGNDEVEELSAATLGEHSAVNRALAAHLPSRFALQVNGTRVDWPGEQVRSLLKATDPADHFERLEPATDEAPGEPIVHKAQTADDASADGAVGLQSEQKRTVHLRADARCREDGLIEIGAECVQPAGSRFMLLADPDGPSPVRRAPCGLTYLSAGIAFCFMTQLGRYAQIKKLALNGYRIVQRTLFGNGAWPVETAVFLESDDTPENNLAMVRMGERTCYVHTSLREPVELVVSTRST